jgi:predicted alpha/beta hydrolase
MQAKQTVLTCADQQTLSAQYYECDVAKGMVIIGSALGVSQHYYKRFASYLVEQGFHVLTFDYRFTGDSSACREGAGLALQDWGRQDVEAAIQFAATKNLPIYFVGHSIGGQIVGLAPSAEKLSKLVFVASSAPYWRRWSFPGNLKILFSSKLLFPLIAACTKQFPTQAVGLGNIAIPSAFIRQWAAWMRKPNYLLDPKFGLPGQGYRELSQPILSLGFTDDALAPEANIRHLVGLFSSADAAVKMIDPQQAGVKSLGHTGFFRDSVKDSLWSELSGWLAA